MMGALKNARERGLTRSLAFFILRIDPQSRDLM